MKNTNNDDTVKTGDIVKINNTPYIIAMVENKRALVSMKNGTDFTLDFNFDFDNASAEDLVNEIYHTKPIGFIKNVEYIHKDDIPCLKINETINK